MQRTLTIKRKSRILQGVAASAVVILDGEEIGRIRNGEERTWQISESSHKLIITSTLTASSEALIPDGRPNAAFALDIGKKTTVRAGWILTEIEAPQRAPEPPAASQEPDNALAAQAAEDELYREKIGQLVVRTLHDSDEDAFFDLEDMADTSLEVLGRHNGDKNYITMFGLHHLALAKYILEDIFNIDEAEDHARKAENAFRIVLIQKEDSKEDLSELELYHRVAVYYDAYCSYYRDDKHGALEEIERYPATLAALALAAVCRTKIAMEEGGDLYDGYQALRFWEEKALTEDAKVIGIMTEDVYSTAYALLELLMTEGVKDDPRIPSGKTEMAALVQNMEIMKARFKDEETIEKMDYVINKCLSYSGQ